MLQHIFQDLALAGQACSLAVMAAVKQLMQVQQQAQQQQQAMGDPPGSRQLQQQRYETLQAAISLQSTSAPETVVAALQAAQASLEASVTDWACNHVLQLHRSIGVERRRADEAEQKSMEQQQQLKLLRAESEDVKVKFEEVWLLWLRCPECDHTVMFWKCNGSCQEAKLIINCVLKTIVSGFCCSQSKLCSKRSGLCACMLRCIFC